MVVSAQDELMTKAVYLFCPLWAPKFVLVVRHAFEPERAHRASALHGHAPMLGPACLRSWTC